MSNISAIWKLGNATFYVRDMRDEIDLSIDTARLIGQNRAFASSPEVGERRLVLRVYATSDMRARFLDELNKPSISKLERGDGYIQYVGAGRIRESRRVNNSIDLVAVELSCIDAHRYRNLREASGTLNASEGQVSIWVGGYYDTPCECIIKAQAVNATTITFASANLSADLPDGGVWLKGSDMDVYVLNAINEEEAVRPYPECLPPPNNTNGWNWSIAVTDSLLDVADGRVLIPPCLHTQCPAGWYHYIAAIRAEVPMLVEVPQRVDVKYRLQNTSASLSARWLAGIFTTCAYWNYSLDEWMSFPLWDKPLIASPSVIDEEGAFTNGTCQLLFHLLARDYEEIAFTQSFGLDYLECQINPNARLRWHVPLKLPSTLYPTTIRVVGQDNFTGWCELAVWERNEDGSAKRQLLNVSISGSAFDGEHEITLSPQPHTHGFVIEASAAYYDRNRSGSFVLYECADGYAEEGNILFPYMMGGNRTWVGYTIVKSIDCFEHEEQVIIANPQTGSSLTLDGLVGILHLLNTSAYYEFDPWQGNISESVLYSQNAAIYTDSISLGSGGGYVVFMLYTPLPFIATPAYELETPDEVSVAISLDNRSWFDVPYANYLWNASCQLIGQRLCFVKLSGDGAAVTGFKVYAPVAMQSLGRLYCAPNTTNIITITRSHPVGELEVTIRCMDAYL